jgi:hypothetical protein
VHNASVLLTMMMMMMVVVMENEIEMVQYRVQARMWGLGHRSAASSELLWAF